MSDKQIYDILAEQIELMAEKSGAANDKELANITVCMVQMMELFSYYAEKETLEKQLQLLSERSKTAKCRDLADLCYAMEQVTKRILQHTWIRSLTNKENN